MIEKKIKIILPALLFGLVSLQADSSSISKPAEQEEVKGVEKTETRSEEVAEEVPSNDDLGLAEDEARAEREARLNELKGIQDEVSKLKEQITKINGEKDQLKKEIESLSAEVSKLKAQKEKLGTEKAALEVYILKKDTELSELIKKKVSLENEVNQTRSENERMRYEMQRLENISRQINKTDSALEGKIWNSSQRMSELGSDSQQQRMQEMKSRAMAKIGTLGRLTR